MSGTLVISSKHAWTPPGWIFDFALNSIAKNLHRLDPVLANEIVSSTTEVGQGFFDLGNLPRHQQKLFVDALLELESDASVFSDSVLADSAYRDAYVRQLSNLLRLIDGHNSFQI